MRTKCVTAIQILTFARSLGSCSNMRSIIIKIVLQNYPINTLNMNNPNNLPYVFKSKTSGKKDMNMIIIDENLQHS